jgi:hypothetical protein
MKDLNDYSFPGRQSERAPRKHKSEQIYLKRTVALFKPCVTNTTEPIPSSESNNRWATHEIPSFCEKPKAHYRIHKNSVLGIWIQPTPKQQNYISLILMLQSHIKVKLSL